MEQRICLLYGTAAVVIAALVVAGLWYADRSEAPRRAALSELAQCLTENNAVFYGAFWCPLCAQQKSEFSPVDDALPYVECSEPDRKSQKQVCGDENIQRYPTWTFPGGMRCTGSISPEVLAHLSGCALPARAEQPTIAALYTELVEETLERHLNRTGATEQEKQEEMKTARDAVSSVLKLRYGTSLDETEDIGHLLDTVSFVLNRCGGEE